MSLSAKVATVCVESRVASHQEGKTGDGCDRGQREPCTCCIGHRRVRSRRRRVTQRPGGRAIQNKALPALADVRRAVTRALQQPVSYPASGAMAERAYQLSTTAASRSRSRDRGPRIQPDHHTPESVQLGSLALARKVASGSAHKIPRLPRSSAARCLAARRASCQAAENAERRELVPVRKKSFDLGF